MISDKKMHEMWSDISKSYWNAKDLEEKQRIQLSSFLQSHRGRVLELACWNGKILKKVSDCNKKLILSGVDYSEDMIRVAKTVIPTASFMVGDIRKLDMIIAEQIFDVMYCINSLHNLPNPEFVYQIMSDIGVYIPSWWYFIFDIRNKWNPFIYYWYYKNRKKWLSFWTLDYFSVLRYARKNGFKVKTCNWVYYDNRIESGFNSRNSFINFLYSVYLRMTRAAIFAPYIFIILEKK